MGWDVPLIREKDGVSTQPRHFVLPIIEKYRERIEKYRYELG
jgi:hypothetical protein